MINPVIIPLLMRNRGNSGGGRLTSTDRVVFGVMLVVIFGAIVGLSMMLVFL